MPADVEQQQGPLLDCASWQGALRALRPLVQVCDFGLSKVRHASLMSSRSQVGTPGWTAPEVLRSQGYNESSDIYSMGVILWELATRQEPWASLHPMQVLSRPACSGALVPACMEPWGLVQPGAHAAA